MHARPAFRALRPSARRFNSALPPALTLAHAPAPHVGQITTLTLCSPSHNALTYPLLSALSSALSSLSPTTTRGLIVTSSSPKGILCAGANLKERLSMTHGQTRSFLSELNRVFAQLSAVPAVSVAVIPKLALGGGLELALCTDFRVAGLDAEMGLPESKLAIVPGAGGTWRLPAVVGRQRARDIALTGRRVVAGEALRWGLVDRVAEDAEEEARRLLWEVLEGGPVAIEALRELYRGEKLGEEAERMAYERVLGTEDRIEALMGFSERRKPSFKGK